jgi:hypothetical protein
LGVIEIDFIVAGVTVSVVLPDTVPDVATTTVEPTAKELARPEVASTVATVGMPEVHLTL